MNEKTTDSFELREPVKPEALVPNSPLEPWMIPTGLVLLFLLLVAIAVFGFIRKALKPAADAVSARKIAFEEATAALGQIGNVSGREAAVRCSLILRKYLAVAVADPALYETHEETISRHDALKGFSREARLTTQAGFNRLAALKYAAEIPDVPSTNVVSEATALLQTLHGGFLPPGQAPTGPPPLPGNVNGTSIPADNDATTPAVGPPPVPAPSTASLPE